MAGDAARARARSSPFLSPKTHAVHAAGFQVQAQGHPAQGRHQQRGGCVQGVGGGVPAQAERGGRARRGGIHGGEGVALGGRQLGRRARGLVGRARWCAASAPGSRQEGGDLDGDGRVQVQWGGGVSHNEEWQRGGNEENKGERRARAKRAISLS
jgi:hypothetical protein